MQELIKNFMSLSWGMSLFGMKQLTALANPTQSAAEIDSVVRALESSLGEGLQKSFAAGDRMQRMFVDMALGGRSDRPRATPAGPTAPAPTGELGWGPVPPESGGPG